MVYLLKEINQKKEFFSGMGRRYEKGQTLIEYALIIALIIIVVIVAMQFLGPTTANSYTSIGNTIAEAG